MANTTATGTPGIEHCWQQADVGCLGLLLESFHGLIDYALRKCLIGHFAALVFVALVAWWHVLDKDIRRHLKAIRLVGRSGLVLQIYTWLAPTGNPFIFSFVIIFIDAFALPLIRSGLRFCGDALKQQAPGDVEAGAGALADALLGNRAEALEVQDHAEAIEEKPIKNVYMNVATSLWRVVCTFTAQLCLVLCYVWTMNGLTGSLVPPGEPCPEGDDAKKCMDCGKWALAVLVTMVAGDGEMGEFYDDGFWEKVLRRDAPEADQVLNRDVRLGICTYRTAWECRRTLDKVVNSWFRTLLQGTAPILLCTEDPLDFVKDCLAICFILKIDDYETPKGAAELRYEARKNGMSRTPQGAAALRLFFERVGNWNL